MAFKKPCQKVKPSAPIKTSERKKMKQQIMETYALTSEEGDLLVPDPILSFKFDTHVKGPGVAYTSTEGEPLWFNLGKKASDLIPTVYTLWKKPTLLPILSTPSSVIPFLVNGADLMIPGVIERPVDTKKNELVSIRARNSDSNLIGPPLAVGRMAIDSSDLPGQTEGKAVIIIHTYEDNLWRMGSKSTPPEPVVAVASTATSRTSEERAPAPALEGMDNGNARDAPVVSDIPPNVNEPPVNAATPANDESQEAPQLQTLTPEEVTSLLRKGTIHAIHAQLSTLPPTSFPIPSSLLYSSYILPCRPAMILKFGTPVDIKHSSHKNLTSLLKSLEKDGLLKLKDFKGDLNILSFQTTHPEVLQHKPYRTIGDKEKAEEKRAAEEKLKQEKVREMLVRELWVPSRSTIEFFQWIGKSTREFYAAEDLRTIVNQYVMQNSLVNQNDQRYINLDEILRRAILVKGEGSESTQFISRSDIVKRLCEGMEAWHEITVDGKEPVRRKGPLKPIEILCKVGHRTQTFIKFFEPFFVSHEFLGNELRRICSASTDVTTGGKEGPVVRVQGKHVQPIVNLLTSQGVPKRCIEVSEEVKQKKK